MAFTVGSGSPQLIVEVDINIAPILSQTVNVEVITVPGLRSDKMPIVQIPSLPLGIFVVRSESIDKDLLRVHIFNVTNSTASPGQHKIRILVP